MASAHLWPDCPDDCLCIIGTAAADMRCAHKINCLFLALHVASHLTF